MFERAFQLTSFLLLAVLIGCAGQPHKITPLKTPATPEPPKSEPTVTESKPIAPGSPSTKPVTPIEPQRTVPVVPTTGWISLREWCAGKHLDAPTVKISSTETNVEVRAESGSFVFDPPRRNAHWNGYVVGVGFPLQFIEGQPYIHALDVAKVLEPLMMPTISPIRKAGGVLVLDAGHGGANEGAHSIADKGMEKEYTLDWAKRVEKLLQGSAWKVFMTRTADVDLGLTNRVAFADEKKADLFISLHFNSFSKRDEGGLETYCFTPQGMSSHITRDYADPVNEAFGNNQFDVENLLLAYDLHRSLLKHTNRKDRGIRRARFMTVLREQRCPAVLLEGGYLSNPEEAKLIGSPEFRQKLAEAVVEALGVPVRSLTAQE